MVAPGPYRIRLRGRSSNPVRVLIRPRLQAALLGSRRVGEPLTLVAGLRPASAGALRVRVLRGGKQTFSAVYPASARVQLGTTEAAKLQVEVAALPRAGYGGAGTSLSTTLRLPDLAPGDEGAAVAALANRLAELGYAIPGRTSSFSYELRDSVYAFQKAQDLPRDGVVGQATWARLQDPRELTPRYEEPADHVEIDKARQILLDIHGGRITAVLPVSTAGIAGYYTPVGKFAIYRKVPGLDPSPLGVLLNPLYFVGGYAIHGNPSVPPYPASHGCVRIPNWASYGFYAAHGYGETVYVYEMRCAVPRRVERPAPTCPAAPSGGVHA